MTYHIFFDESNKLDQKSGGYSYYGALGIDESVLNRISKVLESIIGPGQELHFAEYNNDRKFEKYFRSILLTIAQDIHVNIFLVNNEDAKKMGDSMGINEKQLRQFFYVKIPERLFYGVTRNLAGGEQVCIILDENNEYETPEINLNESLHRQMNAHSAYRKKGYRIESVISQESHESLLLQIIDVLIGMVVFLIEEQYKETISTKERDVRRVKGDLVYRILLEPDMAEHLQSKIRLYEWNTNSLEQILPLNLGDYLSKFLVEQTQYDLSEMLKLQQIRCVTPSLTTRELREAMGYSNSRLKTIQGYLDQLNGKSRNHYYTSK
ncbi:DUF3800 domain-containing protein [Saccharibacillus sacchari]|uniref:DUF3800 domain-containing protein n=1 Tax=Saccharibacillus sacchari TaxID=456493 RepID=A0ACC6P7H7_9BACL